MIEFSIRNIGNGEAEVTRTEFIDTVIIVAGEGGGGDLMRRKTCFSTYDWL